MTGPSPVEIKRHGASLALAIHTVRSDGRTVAPFKGGLFRVGDGAAMDVCSAADIQGMAARIITKRQTASSKPRARTSERPAIPVPAGGREGTPVASRAGVSPATPICEKCSGPRSKESKALCASCYAQAGRGSYPARPVAESPDKFWRAVGPGDEPSKSCGGGESRPALGRPVGENHSTERALPKVENREVPSGTKGSANGDGCRAGAGVAPGPQDPKDDRPANQPPINRDFIDWPCPIIEPELCGCGRPRKGHRGHCWFKRGEPGPKLKRTPQRGAKCAGPGCTAQLSYSARGNLCRKCHLATVRKPAGQATRIAALECEVDALKSAAARHDKAIAELRAQLGIGETR